MKLSDLPTPCLVLDRAVLARNIDRMAQAVGRLGVALRPHMKTAKSIDVARMVLANQAAPCTGITVSTLAEAEYFSAHGITDILYAVGITPSSTGPRRCAPRASIFCSSPTTPIPRPPSPHIPPGCARWWRSIAASIARECRSRTPR